MLFDAVDVIWVAKFTQTWENWLHQHAYGQMTLLAQGEAVYLTENGSIPMRRDCLYFTAPGVPHGLLSTGSKDPVLLDVKYTVSCEELLEKQRELPTEIRLGNVSMYSAVLHTLLQEAEAQSYAYRSAINLRFSLLMLSLLREQSALTASVADIAMPLEMPARSAFSLSIDSIGDYIKANLSQPLSVKALADSLHVNMTDFERMFQQRYHEPPSRYISRLRIEHAAEALSFSQASITEIAYETGFHSIHYFSRCFKEQTGYSPSAFRKRQRSMQSIRLDDNKIIALADHKQFNENHYPLMPLMTMPSVK